MTDANSSPSSLRLTTGFFWMMFLLHLFKPRVQIDGGAPIPIGWGETTLPMEPGNHTVSVWFNYLFPKEAGKATTTVDVAPGAQANLTYRAPWLVFLAGKLRAS